MKKRLAILSAILLLLSVLAAEALLANTENTILNVSGGRAGYNTALLQDPDRIPLLMIKPEQEEMLYELGIELWLKGAYWDLETFAQYGIEDYGTVDRNGVFKPDVSQKGYLTGMQMPYGVEFRMEPGANRETVIIHLASGVTVNDSEAVYIPILVEITGEWPTLEINDPGSSGVSTFGIFTFTGGREVYSQVRTSGLPEFAQTVTLPDLAIREMAYNAIGNGVIMLQAPNGYRWINIDQIRLSGRNISNVSIASRNYRSSGPIDASARQILGLELAMDRLASENTRNFVFQNLQLEADSGNMNFGPVYVSLSGCNMEPETVAVANRVRVYYTFRADDQPAPRLIAGHNPADAAAESIRTLKVTLEESMPGRWSAGRTTTFSLPQGITARAVLVNTENLAVDLPRDTLIRRIDEFAFALNTESSGSWTLAPEGLTIRSSATKSGANAKLELTFFLVADASFRGPVTVTLGGSAVGHEAAAVIAEVAEGAADARVVLKIGSTEMNVGAQTIQMDVAPFIEDGYTMVPVRYVANALGLPGESVVWNENAETVTIYAAGRTAVLHVGSRELLINGIGEQIPKAPVIRDGRTFLPFRALGEQVLGVFVLWDPDAWTAAFI